MTALEDKVIITQKLEQARKDYQKWDIYELTYDESEQHFIYDHHWDGETEIGWFRFISERPWDLEQLATTIGPQTAYVRKLKNRTLKTF